MVRWMVLALLLVAVTLVTAEDDHDTTMNTPHNEEEHDMPSSDNHQDTENHSEDEHHQDEGENHHQDDHDEDSHHQDDGESHHQDDEDETHHGEETSDGGHSDDEDQSEDKTNHIEHDAFLGDHVKELKKLEGEERKKKLDEIVKDEVDTDKDGFVTEDELRARFRQTTRMYRKREVEETLKYHDENKDGKVSWEEFQKNHYAGENDTAHDEAKELLAQDEKKFHLADVDGDKSLDVDEYHTFYHPVDDARMSRHAIEEHLQKHDTDKDGHISFDEYLHTFNDLNDESKVELKKDFDETYDKNRDGKLDTDEMRHWVIPDDEFATEEPKKLVKEADDDKDGKLSLDEINKHLHLFMDSANNEDAETEGEHDEL